MTANSSSDGAGGLRCRRLRDGVAITTKWPSAVAVPGSRTADSEAQARGAAYRELTALRTNELVASRARIVAASDEARRRIERDLHDGAQQRLVALRMRVWLLQESLPAGSDLRYAIADFAEELAAAIEELRQLTRGIHPAVLSDIGLRPALRALCRRAVMPVELNFNVARRLPAAVEVAAYYVVAEALTNAAKHARASLVTLNVDVDDVRVRISVADDGIGGANPCGSGLIGLKDRVEALGGHMHITSAHGQGTTLRAEIPCAAVRMGAPPFAALAPRWPNLKSAVVFGRKP